MAKVRVKKEVIIPRIVFDLFRKNPNPTLTEGDKTKWEMVTGGYRPMNIRGSYFEIYKKTIEYHISKLSDDTYRVQTYRISNKIDTSRPIKEELWTLI